MQAEEAYSPGDMGLSRLMRDVEAEVPTPVVRRPVLWQGIAAALLAVVVGQAVFQPRGTEPGGFELAGGDAAMTIAIRPDTTEAALRSLLLDAGVEIVGGPSALGLYELAPLEGVTVDEARAILGASEIVESLEVSEN